MTMEQIFSADEIKDCVASLAARLQSDLGERDNLLIVAILEGALRFADDLGSALHAGGMDAERTTLGLSSYGSGTTAGKISVTSEIPVSVKGRTVLLLDDIADTGQTLLFAKKRLEMAGADRIVIVVLLDKEKLPASTHASLKPFYAGLKCPDRFVVGYGMDFDGDYRDLDFIAALRI